jgi:hypothetical protein
MAAGAPNDAFKKGHDVDLTSAHAIIVERGTRDFRPIHPPHGEQELRRRLQQGKWRRQHHRHQPKASLGKVLTQAWFSTPQEGEAAVPRGASAASPGDPRALPHCPSAPTSRGQAR